MADLTSGASAKIQLDPGQSLRVEAEGGTTNVTTLYGAPAGTTAVTGSTKFGPYSVPAMLRVVCASGACSYATVRDEPAANSLTAPQVTALQAVVSGDGNITETELETVTPAEVGGMYVLKDGPNKGAKLTWAVPALASVATWCWWLWPQAAYEG